MIEKSPTKLRLKVRKNHLQINLKAIKTILIAIFATKTAAAIKPIPPLPRRTIPTLLRAFHHHVKEMIATRKSLPSLKKRPSQSSCAAVNVTNSHVIVNAKRQLMDFCES
jgi:hypothetical protein